MDSAYGRELAAAISVVRAAARISQRVLAQADKGAVEKENELGPVTVGDFAIQALLTASLQRAYPEDEFVGEEDASALRASAALCERVWGLVEAAVQEEGASGVCVQPESRAAMCDAIDRCQAAPGPGRVWVFDPIDGTKTFVRREMYAINVALLVDGQQTVAVVACPLLSPDADADQTGVLGNGSTDPSGRGCLLYAVRGHGTHVQPLFGETTPARKLPRHAEAVSATADSLRPVTSWALQTSALDEVHRAVAAQLGVAFPGSDLLGWVPRWASLALGCSSVTVWVYKRRSRHAKVWDHAGAMLLFEEVGGRITDVDGRPIDLLAGRHLSRNFGFVAAPPALHARVLQAVHDVLRAQGRTELLASGQD